MKPHSFKGFKKVQEDKRTATMAHENGHRLQIVKSNLSRAHRRQLEALPLHQAEGSEDPIASNAPAARDPQSMDAGKGVTININPNGQAPAASPEAPAPQAAAPEAMPHAAELNEMQRLYNTEAAARGVPRDRWIVPGQPLSAIDPVAFQAADSLYQSQQNRAQEALQQAQVAQRTQDQLAQKLGVAPAPAPAPASIEEPQGLAAPSMGAPQPPAPPTDIYGDQAFESAYTKGLNAQKQAARMGADAIAQEAAMNVPVIEDVATRQRQDAERIMGEYQSLEKERKAAWDDYNNSRIDPNHYMADMSTGKKIATGIGIMLGGMGAGMAREAGNPVLDQLNKQIDRDLRAQEANLGKKKSLLDANLQSLGSKKDAFDMSKVMYNDIIANQIRLSAEKTKGQLAKATALKTIGQLDMESASIMQGLAQRRALMGNQGGGGAANPASQAAMTVDRVIPKEMRKEAYEEMGILQNLDVANQQIEKLMADGFKASRVGKGGSVPGTTNSKILNEMESTLRGILQANWKGPMSDDEAKKIVEPYVAGWTDSKVDIRRRAKGLQEMIKRNAKPTPILRRYGLENAFTTPAKPEIQYKGGIPYQKVEGGWKRVG